MTKKNMWISGAIESPGSLTAAVKRAGKSISEFCSQKNLSATNQKRCNLAKTLKSFKSIYEYLMTFKSIEFLTF